MFIRFIKIGSVVSSLSLIFIYLFETGYRNVEKIKLAAPKVWEDAGFKIRGYEGYNWGGMSGGYVSYILEKKEEQNPKILYTGFLYKWKDEYHIFRIKAIDAIKPN